MVETATLPVESESTYDNRLLIIVRLREGVDITPLLARYRLTIQHRWPGGMYLLALPEGSDPRSVCEALRGEEGVRFAQPDAPRKIRLR